MPFLEKSEFLRVQCIVLIHKLSSQLYAGPYVYVGLCNNRNSSTQVLFTISLTLNITTQCLLLLSLDRISFLILIIFLT